ncbi:MULTISPECIES: hypothetical protein [unclassified Pseudomonas]|uniref:hypothetical protein n=1 Tax=unclassified Pseudomonas TaxID=196821 RepID=UPI000C86ABB3|nr:MULTISPECIES: hypothetical protein [unclassified Pseudomonas]MBK5436662.1 hypothetical protein [Pseudomonas sp. TH32]PMU16560.1 hypothetical protein C1X90_27435 [Pseudomonas sp. GP01-A9]PMU23506.1 hypothetical protein C1X88_27095 [Pseudomonas sp. GP01-A13]PMU33715.1 hypothetical protein C1X89_26940 [Pseudomonas sp. GP01-A8]PMU48618.1 hypothetical protein C1X85_29615 [Pseudomonas sp. GP01-A6]
MKYDDIAQSEDIHAASRLYAVEVYGQEVINAFPPIPSMILECVLAGLQEEQVLLEVFKDYRLPPPNKETEQ